MNLASGLIIISVLVSRSAGQTEAGSGEEDAGSGSGSGEVEVTEVINTADYSMSSSDGSLDMRSEVAALDGA